MQMVRMQNEFATERSGATSSTWARSRCGGSCVSWTVENVVSQDKSARPVGEEGRGGLLASMRESDGMNGYEMGGWGRHPIGHVGRWEAGSDPVGQRASGMGPRCHHRDVL